MAQEVWSLLTRNARDALLESGGTTVSGTLRYPGAQAITTHEPNRQKSKRRNSLFGHAARLGDDTAAHPAAPDRHLSWTASRSQL